MQWKSLIGDFRDFVAGERKKQPSLGDLRELVNFAREANEVLRSILPIGPEVVPEMTYVEAISYFVKNRPTDSRVAKGAMLLQDHPQGRMLVQVFLDKNHDLACDSSGKPYGRRLVIKRLDAELADAFGGQDLIVVE
jgi:hypothetical protein